MICQLVILCFILANISSPICAGLETCFSNTSSNDVVLVESVAGDVVYSKNIEKRFIPASTLKILTALTSLHYLGKNFRFRTEFYLDKDQNLIIKGYGDPFLISEIWNEIASIVSKRVTSIRNVVIDDSYFSREVKIPGIGTSPNPFDVPVGALCVNFNTIYIKKDGKSIVSAEPQTPLTPFALRLIRYANKSGRYAISHSIKDAEMYAAELFKHFLCRYGVKAEGRVSFGHVKASDRLIYTYHSKLTLEQIIKGMMKYSNNFIANQIMLVLGAKIYGPPATLKKGISVIKNYARDDLGLKDIIIVEGSGISRENTISPADMAVLLKRFRPYIRLLKKKRNIYYKTGTLRGIKTMAGYISSDKEEYIFVLSLTTPKQDIFHVIDCVAEKVQSPQRASLSPDDLLIR